MLTEIMRWTYAYPSSSAISSSSSSSPSTSFGLSPVTGLRRSLTCSTMLTATRSVAILTALLLILSPSADFATVPDARGIQSLSSNLNRHLASFLETASDFNIIQQSYRAAADEHLTFKELNGAELVRETADALGEIFAKKVKALQEAAKFAEGLTMKYPWGSKIKDVDYVFAKDVNETDDKFSYVQQFKDSVSFDNSSVHIPIDIYRGDVKILHTLAWTSAMDQVWRQNRENDDSLSWQYIGSQTGVLRTFPASRWKGEEPDLYDVRRRPWYTQGASSPKEMLILVDTSGSCHGQALALMKHSIASIIDTLSENDFVNVANFSDDAGLVGCFKTFVQANPRNKKKLIQYVQTLHANGVANYSRGFEFAFKQFETFNKTNKTDSDGADCNQVIMFLTDGGTEKPEELFKKYNPDKTVSYRSVACFLGLSQFLYVSMTPR